MIKLICSDLDGTLLNDKGDLPTGFYDTLRMLSKKGIIFVAASGRLYGTLNNNFRKSDSPLLFIAHNGAVVQYNNDGEEIFGSIIEPHKVNNVTKLLKQMNLQVYLCTKTFAYIENPSEIMLKTFENSDMPLNIVTKLEDNSGEIYRIGIFDPNNIQESTVIKVEKTIGDDFEYQLGGKKWLDLMNKGVSKGSAIKIIQDRFGISKDETMVFGDYYNDISMLKSATFSYAMKNAPDEVKKYAKFIAESNNENSVLKTILATCL
jgi:Cof subfamily protein (haloacid dehalogenase superfamily)